MSRFPGNIIKLPNVTPTQSSASGVWSLKDQMVYQRNNLWPFQPDPYFNYTTLLLQGNVPNTTGPQAMTLPLAYNADASTNNFLVTPNGDVGPRPFSPYFGGNYSVYFDGTTDYLSVSSNAALQLTNSVAFTLEAWVYPVSTSNNPQILFAYNLSSPFQGYSLRINSSSTLFEMWDGTQWISFGSPQLNTWQHIAVSYEGSGATRRFFVNGIQLGAAVTVPSTINWSSGGVSISSSSESFTGYISNVRIVKGTAVYTSNFTPPTQPLQNITNTSLLTCQSNRFIDNSGNNFTITRNGDCRITDNSPFVSTDFTTGAGYFNGTTDYLSVSSPGSSFAMGTGAFTFECWVYTSSSSLQYLIDSRSGAGTTSWLSYIFNSGQIGWGTGSADLLFTGNPTLNAWNHIAYVRTGTGTNQAAMFLNGTRLGNATDSTNYTTSPTSATIASRYTATVFLSGYLSNVRVVKGTAVYDPTQTSITIPTSPLQAVSGTSLLTLQTRAPSQNISFLDSSPNEFLVTKNGNTTQGTFSPFSPTGWGNYFNGTDAYLTGPSGAALQLSTGDFTIEAWVFGPTQAAYAGICGGATTPSGWTFRLNNSGNLLLTNGSTVRTSTATVPTNSWNHVCVSRQGTNLRFFVNGSLSNTITSNSDSIDLTGGGFQVGKGFSVDGVSGLFSGYISNLRIVKGVAVYTGAFTPPASPLTATQSAGPTGSNIQAITGTQTSLLTCQSNRFIDTSSNNFTITRNGSPSVQAFSPFAPANAVSPLVTGGSGYFDGGASSSADYLTWTGTAAGAGAFSYEFWVYSTNGFATMRAPLGVIAISGYNSALDIRMSGSTINASQYNVASNNFTVETLQANTWYHVVICRNASNQLTVFLNGTRSSTGALTVSTNFSGLTSAIGRLDPNNGGDVTGYIAGVRLIVGSTPYDPTQTTIPVPTTPPTAIPNTSLLLNFTNGAAVDATGKNNLESVANAQNSGVQAKWNYLTGGSSILFNPGQTNPLIIPSRQLFNLASGDFTIEAWVYLLSNRTYNFIISKGNAGTREWAVNVGPTELRFYWSTNGSSTGDSVVAGSATLPTGVWMHVAVTRSVNSIRLFKDGNQVGSTGTFTSMYSGTDPVYVGRFMDFTNISHDLDGYLSNLRITKGIARYTTNFNTNLPTGPFPIG